MELAKNYEFKEVNDIYAKLIFFSQMAMLNTHILCRIGLII